MPIQHTITDRRYRTGVPIAGVEWLDTEPATYAPRHTRPDSVFLTSTEAAQRLGCRIGELDNVPSITGPTGTRRFVLDDIDRAPLTRRDRRDLALVCVGALGALAAIVRAVIR